ncbi:glycosyltransferase family 1 protein [Hyphomicrobiales bacterium BP6-180914]|uniref:Glycosyltransferase family 1 protein n=2 Tax=Lichenifustis flavocetrariae TaxID=2949735 RepID=A0AA41YX50_9HYPH|nr:glycosyltransferase family 1 protein [Lichenifustis flavocetrariae]
MMRILVATDAWHPQVNGVVRSLEATIAELRALGVEVEMITPQGFRSVALPTYPGIRLALAGRRALSARLAALRPDHVHIATEGPIGLAARAACLREGRPFTTSYHTQFPDYLAARLPVPRDLVYAALRWFHNAGCGTMVATESLTEDLGKRGFRRLMRWSRGVDATLFHPRAASILDLPRPIFLYVGRVAVEKNVEALLELDLPGSTVIVGDGPARAGLQARYPKAHFLGNRTGELLARTYASADVFVFPSRTDTFGIVLLEALASGLPVAAYPVPGPKDVIATSGAGVLDADLFTACHAALKIPNACARAHALRFTWRESARQFLDNVTTARSGHDGVTCRNAQAFAR